MTNSYRKPSGITIVEVLFSIGIVIMGLMGIAGLIMIAGTQLTQGLKADGMSNLGLNAIEEFDICLLYTSPSPRDRTRSRMPSSA